MSKSRLEKDPDLKCGFQWDEARRDGWPCPHTCQYLVADHPDEHFCCAAEDGRVPVVEGAA